jgi:hypothetical protein
MAMYKKLKVIGIACCMVVLLAGCKSIQVRSANVILLPEERIFTIPAGQKLDVMLDKKPMSMIFPEDMKLVSPTVLVRQEEKTNNALLDKVKAEKNRNAVVAIISAIFSTIAAIFGFWMKAKADKK